MTMNPNLTDFELDLEYTIDTLEDLRIFLDERREEVEEEHLTPHTLALIQADSIAKELIQKLMEVSTYE